MPAIITHDIFGQEVYKSLHGLIGESRDEYHAFLLGCQGPDPLFYNVLVPRLSRFITLGSTMHALKPNELLCAMWQSQSVLSEDKHPVCRAFAFGFMCHYLLDSTVHPLVYWHENRLYEAGVEGLDGRDRAEVHALIESEFDEVVLYTKKHQTIATFSPETEILRGSGYVLSVVSHLYAYAAMVAYGIATPELMYASALRAFRQAEAVFHSPYGVKRAVLGHIEELFRPHSFVRSMSPRAVEALECSFDNHEHATWENPFTGKASNKGFWDLYGQAFMKALAVLKAMDRDSFRMGTVVAITSNLNFKGEPTVATLTVEGEGAPHA
ncbi:MAG: zinc dependent phospholipase C family protein [Eggerthellaceae bacterium]|nr:zinc dependent phospholipase C family protein [Eggerthellaceae bacterium]